MQALTCTADQQPSLIQVTGTLTTARAVTTMSLVELGKKLLACAKIGDTEQVRNLMTKGAPFTTDWLGTSPLHLAAQYGHLQTAEVLLRAGISRDARTKVDRTPLHIAAQEGHTAIVELLISHGADVDAKDMLKMTPLHWAVEREHVDTVQILLQHGANPYIMSKFEKTAFSIAIDNNRVDIMQILQDSKINPLVNQTSKRDMELATLAATESLAGELAQVPVVTHQEEVETSGGENSGAEKSPEPEVQEIFYEEVTDDLQKDEEPPGKSEAGNPSLPTMRLLQAHGITMIPSDNSTLVASAMQSGQTIVLTEAGKLALNLTRNKVQPSGVVINNKSPLVDRKKVITIMPDQLIPVSASGSSPIKIKNLGKFSPTIMKAIATTAVSSTPPSTSQTTMSSTDLAAITQQLEEARRVAEEYKEQLRQKEYEAEQYKKQLQSITGTPTKE